MVLDAVLTMVKSNLVPIDVGPTRIDAMWDHGLLLQTESLRS